MVIVDSGFWIALLNARDKYHKPSVQLLADLQDPLITTWPVLTESCHLLSRFVHHAAAAKLVQAIEEGAATVHSFALPPFGRMKTLMEKYIDLPMDLADASLVVLAEEIGDGRILSTDRRDFKTYRWKNRKPFRNLLFPDD